MAITTPLDRFSHHRLASRSRCKSRRSRCRRIKNHKRSLHSNQQYSITAITDGSGAIVERYAYTAYGTPTITDASSTTRTRTTVGNRYTYTGREWDETLALYHYRARMYDSAAGRFVSRDPITYESGSSNLYQYCAAMPLHSYDPSGWAGRLWVRRVTYCELSESGLERNSYPKECYIYCFYVCKQTVNRMTFPPRRQSGFTPPENTLATEDIEIDLPSEVCGSCWDGNEEDLPKCKPIINFLDTGWVEIQLPPDPEIA